MPGWLSLSRSLDRTGSATYATDTVRLPDGRTRSGRLGKPVVQNTNVRNLSYSPPETTATSAKPASSPEFNYSSRSSSGGGATRITRENFNKMILGQKNQEELDLQAEEKATRAAARQAVTGRLDAEARNLADRQAAQSRAGLFAGDGSAVKGGNRKVSVSGSMDKLEELRQANYLSERRRLLDQKYANSLVPDKKPQSQILAEVRKTGAQFKANLKKNR
jgi:hypothetical protein